VRHSDGASGAALPAGLEHLQRRRAQGARVLVTIGSLTRQKNHAVVIDALPRSSSGTT